MSYHNGSVWPHDNALIALGFAHYGLSDHILRLFGAMFDAASYMDLRRLPELFWWLPARAGQGTDVLPGRLLAPGLGEYHSVRSPAGLSRPGADPAGERVRFRQPRLPDFLDQVVIRNLEVGDSRFDIMLRRYGGDVSVNVLDRRGDGRIAITAGEETRTSAARAGPPAPVGPFGWPPA